METQHTLVLWTEGDWRCEYHPGFGGQGRLEVFRGAALVAAESTPVGESATQRSEAFRQRVIRGDLGRPTDPPGAPR
jgi:hypothetical protein